MQEVPEVIIYMMLFFAGVIVGIILCIVDIFISGTKRERAAARPGQGRRKIVPIKNRKR